MLPLLAALGVALGTRGLLQWQDQNNYDRNAADYSQFVNSLFAPTNYSEQGPTKPQAPNQAQVIQGLLSDPRTAQLGGTLMGQQMQGNYGLMNTQLANQGSMATQGMQNTGAMERSQLEQRSAMDRLRMEIASREKLAQMGGGAAGDNLVAKPQPGYMRVPLPDGGFRDMIIPGSQAHEQAQELIATNQRSIQRLDEMLKLIDQYGGFEKWNPEVSGKMSNAYGQIVADVAKVRGYGVIQPGEMEAIKAGLTDPSSWSAGLARTDKVRAQYKNLLDEQKLMALKLRQKFIGPAFPGSSLNPRTLPPGTVPWTP